MNNQAPLRLLNGCTSVLEKYCNRIHYKISLKESNNGYYSLSCREANVVFQGNTNYNVAIFKDSENLGFHFALKFHITVPRAKKLEYNLTDANLRVFHLNDLKSYLLFRAEFATNISGQLHAQPHWQFEPYLIKTIKEEDHNSILELRQSEIEILDFNKDESNPLNISKLHFAMTSDWHKSRTERIKNAHHVEIDEVNVINWLDGCLEYISHQIKLL